MEFCDFCGESLEDFRVEGEIAGVKVELCENCSVPIVHDWEMRKNITHDRLFPYPTMYGRKLPAQ